MAGKTSWRRKVNRYTPLATAVAGILLVFSSVIFLETPTGRIVAIAAGLVVLEVGVWYMANPIFTSERRYTGLRGELDTLIDLVRKLNRAALTSGAEGELEQVRSAMHDSVDRMAKLAGQEGGPSSREPAA